jgi:hypothetical protein
LTPDSLVPLQHNTMARANASCASYKLKLEQEERCRTEEAEQVRRALEHDRLAVDASQEDQRFKVFRERQEADAAQPLIDHNNLSARDRIVAKVQTADEPVPQKAIQLHSDEEIDCHMQELPHTTDKIRLREESRLRAEEKARARFATFRTAQPPVPTGTNKEEVQVTSSVDIAVVDSE